MTMDDAVDRAMTLWGQGWIVRVDLQTDGAAFVHLSPPNQPHLTMAQHRLDTHGRPTCHPECKLSADARRQS